LDGRQRSAWFALDREIRLVLLLGHKHNADGGVRGHRRLDLSIGHLPHLHRNLQLPGPRLQHQLRRQSHLKHPRAGHRKKQKLQSLQKADCKEQSAVRVELAHQQLHRRVN
jgi:hypothetical protein